MTDRKAVKLPDGYDVFLREIKQRVKSAQLKAATAVNRELLLFYWDIGKGIVERQKDEKWGSGVIDKLARDIQHSFPGIKGFSKRNIFRMKEFYLNYRKVPQAVAQLHQLPVFNIPWGHNAILATKLHTVEERLWYAQKTLEHGWSRNILEMWIKSDLHAREGKAITNFQATLSSPQSDLAHQTMKDPYCFDFVGLTGKFHETELENGLIDHIRKFLLELGHGFSFLGQQYHLEVGGEDYYPDLVFYHIKLRAFVVIELKNTAFKPEHAGKMSFYLAAVDNTLKHPQDNPTIGMILCKTKENFTVEYALQKINAPIGVSGYETQILQSLPSQFTSSLPTVEELEDELNKSSKYDQNVTASFGIETES